MHQAIKDAVTICKTFLRNGYDAHVINMPLQAGLIEGKKTPGPLSIDIACEPDFETIVKLFPNVRENNADARSIAMLEDNNVIFSFYPMETDIAGHPELSLMRITPRMIADIDENTRDHLRIDGFGTPGESSDKYDGFANVQDGPIRLLGLPDETLRHNYMLAIRALRFAANYDLPIDPNTWMAIVRASVRVLDYVPSREIMEEWRLVAAESMHRFVRLLYDAHILQGLIPEVASLACVAQQNDNGEIISNVFEHTLKCMELYPQDGLHYDWLGVMAMLFHDVGKLYTAEYYEGRWTYYQHHRVGAKVTRKILKRLHFDQGDADLICHLVNQHMRFHFMMTDRGIRRFKALGETSRFIAMARADLLSRDESFTSFNHNVKYLDRAETPERMLEPLLNGNEIMQETNLSPGRLVGDIRDALLDAQKTGKVNDRDAAIAFVRHYAANFI